MNQNYSHKSSLFPNLLFLNKLYARKEEVVTFESDTSKGNSSLIWRNPVTPTKESSSSKLVESKISLICSPLPIFISLMS